MRVMKPFVVLVLAASLATGSLPASSSAWAGGSPLGSFHLTAIPEGGGEVLPVRLLNTLSEGQVVRYAPIRLDPQIQQRARIALVLVPSDQAEDARLTVLEAKPAGSPTEWTIPFRTSAVAVVFGPHGLDVKKINSVVGNNRELIAMLADYAEQTGQLEALMDTLMRWEQSRSGDHDLDAAIRGFSARYAVPIPRLNSNAPADQQASVLLRAIVPALATYDPLTTERSAVIQQSTSLAAAVAGLVFGTPVGLIAGGAALAHNLRSIMFPDSEFRSAFAQTGDYGAVALSTKPRPARSRTRTAYLWAIRVPDVGAPVLSVSGKPHLPLGTRAPLKVAVERNIHLRYLFRSHQWMLIDARNRDNRYPVTVTPGNSADTLLLDLTDARFPAGSYHLTARWDWDEFEAEGTFNIHPPGELQKARLTPDSEDRLVEGRGPVMVTLTGVDFQFVEKVTLNREGVRRAQPLELVFTLPLGARAGEQLSMEIEIDTNVSRRGVYSLAIQQADGSVANLPLEVHSPHPAIENLPLRVNLGETRQEVLLRGSGLDRIGAIEAGGMEWELSAPNPRDERQRVAAVRLLESLPTGSRRDLSLRVTGLNQPLTTPSAIVIAGPRPQLVSLEKSFPDEVGVELHEGEIPAGLMASFALRLRNLDSRSSIELRGGGEAAGLSLRPGEQKGTAKLDFAGEDVFFLSLDPGALAASGSVLEAVVHSELTGGSDPFSLGRVTRVPRIEKFTLLDERIGGELYAGLLTGEELHTIEKVGWDSETGYPVQSIPSPMVGAPRKQTLRIGLPWPAPSPRAPVYIWLHGESKGRATQTRF
jgi:hypothetical protein